MEPLEAIDKMLSDKGRTRLDLARSLGRRKESVYNMFRTRPDIKISTMLGACAFTGFKMVLVSEDGAKIEVEPQETGRG